MSLYRGNTMLHYALKKVTLLSICGSYLGSWLICNDM